MRDVVEVTLSIIFGFLVVAAVVVVTFVVFPGLEPWNDGSGGRATPGSGARMPPSSSSTAPRLGSPPGSGAHATSCASAEKPHSATRRVYVVSATTGDVVRIDPRTCREVETIHLGAAYLSSIAVAGEYLYYASSPESQRSSIGRYDLRTKKNQPKYIAQQFYEPMLQTSPRQPGVLYVGERGQSPADIQKWRVSSGDERPSLLAQSPFGSMGSNLGDFQISDDGKRLWSACGAPYDFLELRTSDLRLSGRIFPAVPYPNSVSSTRRHGVEYLLGGTDSYGGDKPLHLYENGDPASRRDYGDAQTGNEAGSVAISPDARRIYRVVSGADGANASVETFSTMTGSRSAAAPMRISKYFWNAIEVEPVTGKVFVSLDNAVGVLDREGRLLKRIRVAGPGEIVVA